MCAYKAVSAVVSMLVVVCIYVCGLQYDTTHLHLNMNVCLERLRYEMNKLYLNSL